jgi:hypothetical protein
VSASRVANALPSRRRTILKVSFSMGQPS